MRLLLSLLLSILVIEIKAQDTLKHVTVRDTLSFVTKIAPETKLEIESEYPGGQPAWNRFLMENMRYPDKAIKKEIQGIVVVQFIVDVDGSVSNVQAISGPEKAGLREEAVRIIKLSGKWIPAIQYYNNVKSYVKSYKKQLFMFKLEAR